MDNTSLLISVAKGSISPITTLLAAFFGAWFAYRFQNRVKEADKRSIKISAANKAMFNAYQLLNSLTIFQKDIIDPCRGRPDICFTMLPLLPEDHSDFQFDFNALGFILDTKHRKLLFDLFIEQQRYKEVVKVINYRSKLHKDIVQPGLVSAGIKKDIGYDIDIFINALGPLIYEDIKNLTDQVVYHVDRTIISLEATKNNMLTAFKDLFPNDNIVSI